ncbi:MAG: FAD-dependent oxidoreductase [Clostridia bacterium]|nr:FAD-dependent oxidoreductase [Clostridia bacterium]
MEKIYDVLIVGGGVAGMTAAVYAKRRGKKVAIIEKFALGGQVLSLNKIENFPSQTEIDGFTLSQMFANQIRDLDIPVLRDSVVSVDLSTAEKVIFGKSDTYKAKSVIIATGLSSVSLGVGEDKFLGSGVSYCVVCDANFFKGKNVCVASKNGSGIKGAMELAEICSHVTVLDSEDMSLYAAHNKNSKIKIISNAVITGVEGENFLEKVLFKVAEEEKTIKTAALFVELGKKALTDIFAGVLKDEKGFIITNENMETSIKDVYSVGDVRANVLKQIVTACSDGAIAGQNA